MVERQRRYHDFNTGTERRHLASELATNQIAGDIQTEISRAPANPSALDPSDLETPGATALNPEDFRDQNQTTDDAASGLADILEPITNEHHTELSPILEGNDPELERNDGLLNSSIDNANIELRSQRFSDRGDNFTSNADYAQYCGFTNEQFALLFQSTFENSGGTGTYYAYNLHSHSFAVVEIGGQRLIVDLTFRQFMSESASQELGVSISEAEEGVRLHPNTFQHSEDGRRMAQDLATANRTPLTPEIAMIYGQSISVPENKMTEFVDTITNNRRETATAYIRVENGQVLASENLDAIDHDYTTRTPEEDAEVNAAIEADKRGGK